MEKIAADIAALVAFTPIEYRADLFIEVADQLHLAAQHHTAKCFEKLANNYENRDHD